MNFIKKAVVKSAITSFLTGASNRETVRGFADALSEFAAEVNKNEALKTAIVDVLEAAEKYQNTVGESAKPIGEGLVAAAAACKDKFKMAVENAKADPAWGKLKAVSEIEAVEAN